MSTPTDVNLKTALSTLRAENPGLGTSKMHGLLLQTYPTWTVSEKRMRKVLKSEGLMVPGSANTMASNDGKGTGRVYPSSRIIEGLDVSKWTNKVEVAYFDAIKGKGLIATENISEGEVVWKEDPFIIAPEWEIYDMQQTSRACAFCTTPLTASPLILPCPSLSSATASSPNATCPAKFCNRLCLARSAQTHPLLCRAQNPASAPLLRFAREHEWMALHALAQCTSRVLGVNACERPGDGSGSGALARDWAVVKGLAELGMEDRVGDILPSGLEPDRATWKKGYTLYLQAFRGPRTPAERRKLEKLLNPKRPLGPDIEEALFGYEAFLRGLGRMSLNLESHGGLYTLHAHLNHSCMPNISARHLDTRTALARLTLLAKRDIARGEELVVAYVNPGDGVRVRRAQLLGWGFGRCECARCEQEGAESEEGKEGSGGLGDLGDLERELKAGLGVM